MTTAPERGPSSGTTFKWCRADSPQRRLDLFPRMMKRRLLSEVEQRIKDLSEAQLEGWLRGHVSLVDVVIERYGDAIMDHRDLAISVLRSVTVDEVRQRLRVARPELVSWWDSEDFDRAFTRETERIMLFLGEDPSQEGEP